VPLTAANQALVDAANAKLNGAQDAYSGSLGALTNLDILIQDIQRLRASAGTSESLALLPDVKARAEIARSKVTVNARDGIAAAQVELDALTGLDANDQADLSEANAKFAGILFGHHPQYSYSVTLVVDALNSCENGLNTGGTTCSVGYSTTLNDAETHATAARDHAAGSILRDFTAARTAINGIDGATSSPPPSGSTPATVRGDGVARTGSDAAPVIERPANAVAGDIILAPVGAATSTVSLPTLAGWTVVEDPGSSSGERAWLLARVATASDPAAWTLGLSAPSNWITRATAVKDTSTALAGLATAAAGLASTTSQLTHQGPSVDPPGPDHLILHFVVSDNGATWAPGTGTEQYESAIAGSITIAMSAEARAADAAGGCAWTASFNRTSTLFTVPFAPVASTPPPEPNDPPNPATHVPDAGTPFAVRYHATTPVPVAVEGTGLRFNWRQPVADSPANTGFIIAEERDNGTWAKVADIPAGTLTYLKSNDTTGKFYIAAVNATGVGAIASILTVGSAPPPPPPPHGGSLVRLTAGDTADAAFVRASDGVKVRLPSTNIFALNSSTKAIAWGQDRYQALYDYGYRLVRLICPWRVYHTDAGAVFDTTAMANLDTVISRANAVGLYVYIDIHLDDWNQPPVFAGSQNADADPGDVVAYNTYAKPFVQHLANRYASNPGMVGIDLFNEPRIGDANQVLDYYRTWIGWLDEVAYPGIAFTNCPFGNFDMSRGTPSKLHGFSTAIVHTWHSYYDGSAGDGYNQYGMPTNQHWQGGGSYSTANIAGLRTQRDVQIAFANAAKVGLHCGEFAIDHAAGGAANYCRDQALVLREAGLSGSWWLYSESSEKFALKPNGSWRAGAPELVK